MRDYFHVRMPEVARKIYFYFGDVCNKSTLKYAMKGMDYVFHAAALKQIPSGSFEKKLYSTYLSYLLKEKVAFSLKMNVDSRGSFTELIHTLNNGK